MKKRILALMLVLALTLSLCACGDADEALDLAKQAMRKSDQSRVVSAVYVMRYTGRVWLSDKTLTENKSVYNQIPEEGTLVVIDGKDGVYDYQLFFFNERGSLALCEDALELHEESEQAYKSVSLNPSWAGLDRYTTASELYVYFWGIGVDAYCGASAGKDAGVPSSMENNTWYQLSEKQLKKVLN